ncbi:MAG: hypothetical protein ABEJ79_10220 [Halolamina sp.]
MLDAPVDAWYVWVGLAVVSLSLLGTVAALPTQPPPNAATVADAVDRAATATPPATTTVRTGADEIALTPTTVSLRNDAGTASATFAFGTVTPVTTESALWPLLKGTSPGAVFDDPEAFRQALVEARAQKGQRRWRPADGPVRVRHLAWRGVETTLVGH